MGRRKILFLVATIAIAILMMPLPSSAASSSSPSSSPSAVASAESSAAASKDTVSDSQWAGFVVGNHNAPDVRGAFGKWIVPATDCTATANGDSLTWVGIGGAVTHGSSGDTLYQTGTASNCVNGKSQYFAWVDDAGNPNLFGKAERFYQNPNLVVLGCSTYNGPAKPSVCTDAISVKANDSITAAVVDHSKYTRWTISDHRNGHLVWTHTKTWVTHSHRYTAECVEEDPGGSGGTVLSFADFGKVTFSQCDASDQTGHLYSVSSPPKQWVLNLYQITNGSSLISSTNIKNLEVTYLPTTNTSTGTASSSAPTLGISYNPTATGFGKVTPSEVQYGGDGYSVAKNLKWTAWGTSQATGTGTGWYVPAGDSQDQGSSEPITVVAFDLGRCGSTAAYESFSWYFPTEGESFESSYYLNACTGQLNIPSTTSVPPTTATTAPESTNSALCTGSGLAAAASSWEAANDSPDGTGSAVQYFACVNGYAGIVFVPGNDPGTGALMSFRTVDGNWVAIGEGNLLPTEGIPTATYQQLSQMLSSYSSPNTNATF